MIHVSLFHEIVQNLHILNLVVGNNQLPTLEHIIAVNAAEIVGGPDLHITFPDMDSIWMNFEVSFGLESQYSDWWPWCQNLIVDAQLSEIHCSWKFSVGSSFEILDWSCNVSNFFI